MSYLQPNRRALSGVSTRIPALRARSLSGLGSLGDDGDSGTLSQPTLVDPATVQWQSAMLAQVQAGVESMRRAETQKWVQVGATIMIPVFTMIWKAIVKRGGAT